MSWRPAASPMAPSAPIWRWPPPRPASATWRRRSARRCWSAAARASRRPRPAARCCSTPAPCCEQAERLREDLGAYAGGLAGQVRVLSNTNALTEFLPEALSSFLAAHPHVSVDLEERLSDEIVGLIAEGVGDIGIVAGTVDAGAADHLSVPQRPLRAGGGARSSARRARQDRFRRGARSRFRRARPRQRRCSASSPTRPRRIGRPLRLRVQLRSFDAVCRLVECDVGVGIVPETTARARRQGHGDQGGRSHRPLGGARPDDLRARLRRAAAVCAPARRAHAGPAPINRRIRSGELESA